jgi:hypothetical protein
VTSIELAYRAELRANWSSFAWWKGRGWSRLPGWVKRRRETMKMRGHPCRGCSSIAFRGEIYSVESLPVRGTTRTSLEEKLNNNARAGWELVSMVVLGQFIVQLVFVREEGAAA